MRDDNLNLNNLNIPPSDSSTSRFDWLNILHLVAPIALGYVYYKGKQEKADLEEKLRMEVALREERELKLKQQEIPAFDKGQWLQEIVEITKEEEERAKQTLKRLSKVENYIKQILDIRCSPIMPRTEREQLERYLLELSNSEQFEPLDMRDGLNQIFQHDGKHCGGGFHNNGQIYRVWMRWWKEKVEYEKKSRIEKRKMELSLKKQ